MTTRILMVDDNKEVLAGMHSVFNQNRDFEIIGDAYDGLQAVQLIRRLKPDVVLMDIIMPYLNGIDATRQIVSENPGIKVIALSVHGECSYICHMLEAGASGYLLKDYILEELQNAVIAVTRNKIYISGEIYGWGA